MRGERRQLTAQEKRAFASAGLTVVRYRADGERAEIRQLAPEGPERRRALIRRFSDESKTSEGA